MTPASKEQMLRWLLDDLVDRVDEIHQVVLLSRDGLVMSASQNVGGEDAEFLAALSSGFFSLAQGAKQHFGCEELGQAFIEIDDRLFFVLPAGVGTCLAVLSDGGPNVSMVAYETSMLVRRLRGHMKTTPRTQA
jgi:predicted regulator of Ras-like GTPase activity (Roadblock/LC7/MglB family)